MKEGLLPFSFHSIHLSLTRPCSTRARNSLIFSPLPLSLLPFLLLCAYQVWRIACRDYSPVLKEHKSLTPAVYEAVGDIFRNKFGSHAGWCVCLTKPKLNPNPQYTSLLFFPVVPFLLCLCFFRFGSKSIPFPRICTAKIS